jgi:hypothetical protein
MQTQRPLSPHASVCTITSYLSKQSDAMCHNVQQTTLEVGKQLHQSEGVCDTFERASIDGGVAISADSADIESIPRTLFRTTKLAILQHCISRLTVMQILQ